MITQNNTTAVNTIFDGAFENHTVRILGTPEDPWFVVNEVCKAAEIANPRDAVNDLDEVEPASFQDAEFFWHDYLGFKTLGFVPASFQDAEFFPVFRARCG